MWRVFVRPGKETAANKQTDRPPPLERKIGTLTNLCGEPVQVFRVGQPTEEKHHGVHRIAGVPLVALGGKQVRFKGVVGRGGNEVRRFLVS